MPNKNTDGWYVASGGQQAGPWTLDKLLRMIAQSKLPDDALVWREGMADWRPWREVPELNAHVSSTPPRGAAAANVAAPPAPPVGSTAGRTTAPPSQSSSASTRTQHQASTSHRPIGVVLTAIYSGVQAVATFVYFFLAAFFLSAASGATGMTRMFDKPEDLIAGMAGAVLAAGIMTLVELLALLEAAACYGLFARQDWAYRLTIIVHGINAGLAALIALILFGAKAFLAAAMTFSSAVLAVLIVIYFLQPPVKRYFNRP